MEDWELSEDIENVEDLGDIEDISEEIKKRPKKKNEEQDTSVRQFRQKKHGGWKWIVVILLIAAVIGFIVFRIISAKNKLQDALGQANTTTAEITRMDISKAISTTGTIQSKDVRTVTSPLSGVKIDKVNFKVGDTVQKGDIVVAFSFEDINKKIGQITEDIDEAYLTYLKERSISYLFAGETELDLPLALSKLRTLGIERILLTGGGLMNRTFLEAGCIDELNLVILPFIDGSPESARLFDGPGGSVTSGNGPDAFAPAGFKLAHIEKLPGDAIWLRFVL